MTKEEYGDFVLRYKGCGACFPMYHTLSRFEKMWFSAIQKDVAELETEVSRLKLNEQLAVNNGKNLLKENVELKNKLEHRNCLDCSNHSSKLRMRTLELEKENAELKKKVENLQKYLDTRNCYRECAETWLKLTEAKKLLKQFLEAKNGEDTYKAEWEAEQFLKEDSISEHIQRATHNYID